MQSEWGDTLPALSDSQADGEGIDQTSGSLQSNGGDTVLAYRDSTLAAGTESLHQEPLI